MFRNLVRLFVVLAIILFVAGCGKKDMSVAKTKEKTTIERETFGISVENSSQKSEIEKVKKEVERLSKENESLRKKLDAFEKQKQALVQEVEKIRQDKNSINTKQAEKITLFIGQIFGKSEKKPENTEYINTENQTPPKFSSKKEVPVLIKIYDPVLSGTPKGIYYFKITDTNNKKSFSFKTQKISRKVINLIPGEYVMEYYYDDGLRMPGAPPLSARFIVTDYPSEEVDGMKFHSVLSLRPVPFER